MTYEYGQADLDVLDSYIEEIENPEKWAADDKARRDNMTKYLEEMDNLSKERDEARHAPSHAAENLTLREEIETLKARISYLENFRPIRFRRTVATPSPIEDDYSWLENERMAP